ncbi:MAG TPA: hypothetical protein VHC01_05960 [Gaiellaceae bacterium]|jgi:hypothetical protein|nr:hypothetical protein [Gaiellaceae bacterium]
MAKRKIRRRTPEEEAEFDRLMERVRARIREREAIDERIAREREQHRQP